MPGKVVSPEEWIKARLDLLAKEKELTEASDALAEQRAKMPMVKMNQQYEFTSFDGKKVSLGDLFDGKRQLLIYHFMFDPDWDEGCNSCSFLVDNMPKHLEHLHAKDTSLVLVSRAPEDKLKTFNERMRWNIPWYSSSGTTFNHDFKISHDPSIRAVGNNHLDELTPGQRDDTSGERPGMSVFWRDDSTSENIYHTYSTYDRGLDKLLGTLTLLDLTPLGRKDAHVANFPYRDRY